MRVIIDEKPELDEYFLEHYGVKGMKWGVRRSQAQLDRQRGAALSPGVSRRTQVVSARKNVRGAKADLERKSSRVQKARNRAYSKPSPETKKALKDAEKKFEKARSEFESNPSRAVSARMTYGEMAVSALFLTPVTTAALVTGTEIRGAVLRETTRKKSS